MNCLSLPQKKLLKIILNVVNDKLDKDLNSQNPQQNNQPMPPQPNYANQQLMTPENVQLAMELVTKIVRR